MRYLDETEKRELLSHLADYLIETGIATARQLARHENFSCPSNDHNDSSPSAHYYDGPNDPRVICFGCGKCWNLFNLLKEREGLHTFKEQVERARELYGSGKTDGAERPIEIRKDMVYNKLADRDDEKRRAEAMAYVEACRKDIFKTDYWYKRGFERKFVESAGLGYDVKSCRLIVPIDAGYVARITLPPDYVEAKGISRYKNPKGLPSSLIGGDELKRAGKLYVVEGALDALAIRQAGGRAVGLNSISNMKLLVAKAKEYNTDAEIIVALDGDAAGVSKGMELAKQLRDAGCRVKFLQYAWNECKDPGEWLEKKGTNSLRSQLEKLEKSKGNFIGETQQVAVRSAVKKVSAER